MPIIRALAFKDGMQSNLSFDEVIQEMAEADFAISDSDFDTLKTWLKSQVNPTLWVHEQYELEEKFWVVATLESSCLYFNFIEEGWGWGKFKESGVIEKYHWEQEELHEAFIWRNKEQLIES